MKQKATHVLALIWRSFFLENDLKKKKGEAKNKATMNIDPTTNNYERRTRHISRRKFYVTNNLNGNFKERIQLVGEVSEYLCWKILGLRSELDKAVKCLYNTNI